MYPIPARYFTYLSNRNITSDRSQQQSVAALDQWDSAQKILQCILINDGLSRAVGNHNVQNIRSCGQMHTETVHLALERNVPEHRVTIEQRGTSAPKWKDYGHEGTIRHLR